MKYRITLAAVSLFLYAAPGYAETITTVECDNAKVITNEDQTAQIKASTGEADFGSIVCAVVATIDVAAYTDPTDVKITLPNGNSYDVQLQANN